MTLRQLSGAAHVSLSYLSEIERGQKEVSGQFLTHIARGLGVRDWQVLIEAGYLMQEMDNLTNLGLRSVSEPATV
jgi:transcriptional regulator with XRE-family HTH domain